ncbi:MAG: ABC transporter permease [Bacteroidota bacterium]
MIFTIFRKELKETLRDRRTLMMMLVIPILVFPVILNVFVKVSSSFQKEAAEKTLKIGLVGDQNTFIAKEMEALPTTLGKKKITYFANHADLVKALNTDSIELGIEENAKFQDLMNDKKTAQINVLFDMSELGLQDRAEMYLNAISAKAKQARLTEMKIEAEKIEPLRLDYQNIATDKEMFGKLAGGMLPYIFIAFGFIGCMYPAIDLFTGEKERGTIETLLTTPVSRWQILFGKMLVVVLSGLIAATFALIGLYISIGTLDTPENGAIMNIIYSILTPQFIVLLFGLLIPLTVFFAGVMVPIAVNAKTFKEAQSVITPLNIIMVLPAMVGFFPGIELNWITACIPVVNVVLATKELIAGTLDIGMLALSFIVMISIAIVAVFVSYKRFDQETNIVN